jgi:hypothetical protein
VNTHADFSLFEMQYAYIFYRGDVLLRRPFVPETFCYRRRSVTETFCYGDVLYGDVLYVRPKRIGLLDANTKICLVIQRNLTN